LRRQGLIKDETVEEVPPPTTSKSKDKAKDKKNEKDKGKVVEEEEPDDSVKWVELDIDPVSHKYLPRIVIPKKTQKDYGSQAKPSSMAGPGSETTNSVNGEPAGDGGSSSVKVGEEWASKRKLEYPFVKFWTEEQRKRSEVDRMLAESNLPTSYDKLVNEARRKGIPPPDPPTAEGPYKDELMVSVFHGVAQMTSLVDRAFNSGGGNGNGSNVPHGIENMDSITSPTAASGGGGGHINTGATLGSNSLSPSMGNSNMNIKAEGDYFPFMWDAIYPKDASGRPCYNPKGIYVVRVWAAGSWRAIVVDDQVPLNFKVMCGGCCFYIVFKLYP
jgi:hypothetical protein